MSREQSQPLSTTGSESEFFDVDATTPDEDVAMSYQLDSSDNDSEGEAEVSTVRGNISHKGAPSSEEPHSDARMEPTPMLDILSSIVRKLEQLSTLEKQFITNRQIMDDPGVHDDCHRPINSK